MTPPKPFTLCDYFDRAGQRVERLYLVNDPGDAATERVLELVRSARLERLLDVKMADAIASGEATSLDDAALALNAIINQVAEGRVALVAARRIASIGVDFRKAVEIADIMPSLETNFGGYAVSWARGIFYRLDLGSPLLN